jgi:calcineurin-like phosphoesterase family protein
MLAISSDWHLGHSNIIKYSNRLPFLCPADREFFENNGGWDVPEDCPPYKISAESTALMDNALIGNINSVVGPNDELWFLGDFAFAPKQDYYRRCREYRDRIHCQNVNIIWGNHDHRSIRDLFNHAYDLYELEIGRQKISLCHYAMAIFNKSHRGAWHLYGHSHGGAESWFSANMPGRRAFDVGVDNAAVVLGSYRPFTFDEIKQIMGFRKGFWFDHHQG